MGNTDFGGPDLKHKRAGGGSALRGGEALFIEETCTQGLYPCSLLVGLLK
jgi:hypothetical protein